MHNQTTLISTKGTSLEDQVTAAELRHITFYCGVQFTTLCNDKSPLCGNVCASHNGHTFSNVQGKGLNQVYV